MQELKSETGTYQWHSKAKLGGLIWRSRNIYIVYVCFESLSYLLVLLPPSLSFYFSPFFQCPSEKFFSYVTVGSGCSLFLFTHIKYSAGMLIITVSYMGDLRLWIVNLLKTSMSQREVKLRVVFLPSMYFLFFGGTWVWTQGLTLARQAVYHLSHAPALFGLLAF
jgi:hypothetical protein